MKLNCNFDPTLESVINLCSPLADWFERNQETMAYFELTHKGCLHFEESSMVSTDIRALAIAGVYEENKEELSETAKVQYYIDVEELQKDNNQEKSKSL